MNEFKQGSLQSRFINDLNILREAITRVLNNLIRDFFTLIGTINKYVLFRLGAYFV